MKAFCCFCWAAVLGAADTGTATRPSPAAYEAHQGVRGATIAASRMAQAEVTRTFSSAVAKNFVVVEVAIFPDPGATFDVQVLDFDLKGGSDDRLFAQTPEEVAWHGKKQPNTASRYPGISDRAVHVVGEAGVIVGTRTNPATGRTEHGVGTYEGVGVTNMPQPSAPPPSASSSDNIYAVEGRLRGWELQEGPAVRPISGYLYFPASKKLKSAPVTLEYEHSGERASLILNAK